MTETEFQTMTDQRRERMLRELSSDLADRVEAGELSDEEANVWFAHKADQWNT